MRAVRSGRGLSQEKVAIAAGIGRSTLVHMESGEDVQISSLMKVAKVLDLQIGIVGEGLEHPHLVRLQARSEQKERVQESREKHLRISARLAMADGKAKRLRDDALRMIDVWEKNGACSHFYIESWRKILRGSLQQCASRMLDLDREWEPALLQNTPFMTERST